MGLDDREQRILAEIERQFYEEDPDLADAVRNITRRAMSPWNLRFAAIGAAIGLVVVLWTFTWNIWVALAGFAVLVVSGSTLIHGLRARAGKIDSLGSSRRNLVGKLRWSRRFRRRG